MNDDELLRGIARAARDERDDASDAGSATLDAAANERIALALLATSDRTDSASSPEPSRAPADAGTEPRPRPRSDAARSATNDEHAPAKPRPLGRVVYLFAPIAAAAALFLYLRTSSEPGFPPYTVTLSSSARTERGAVEPRTDEALLQPDSFFELVARPAEPARGIVAHASVVHAGTKLDYAGAIEVSDEGAVRLSGRAKDVFHGTRGSYEIVVSLERPSGNVVRTVRGRVRFTTDP